MKKYTEQELLEIVENFKQSIIASNKLEKEELSRATLQTQIIPKLELHFYANLEIARACSKLSQTDIGNALGVTFQQFQKYEKGIHRFSINKTQILANKLGVNLFYLFFVNFSAIKLKETMEFLHANKPFFALAEEMFYEWLKDIPKALKEYKSERKLKLHMMTKDTSVGQGQIQKYVKGITQIPLNEFTIFLNSSVQHAYEKILKNS